MGEHEGLPKYHTYNKNKNNSSNISLNSMRSHSMDGTSNNNNNNDYVNINSNNHDNIDYEEKSSSSSSSTINNNMDNHNSHSSHSSHRNKWNIKKVNQFFNLQDLKLKNLKSSNSQNKKKFFICLFKLLGMVSIFGFLMNLLLFEKKQNNNSKNGLSSSFRGFFTDYFNDEYYITGAEKGDEEEGGNMGSDFVSLEDPEYYNFDYRNMDLDTIGKFDKGAKHFLITNEAKIVTDKDKKAVEAELEMLLASSVQKYDLKNYEGTANGKENREHVLLCIPLRNAEAVLPLMFKHLMNLTYPHELIDLSFLVSDCSPDDKTLDTLIDYSKELQNGTLSQILQEIPHSPVDDLHLKYMNEDYLEKVKKAFSPPFHDGYNKPFRSVQIFQKDFGQVIGQGFSDRHAVKVQGVRRKLMGRARNWLASNSLKPYHSWIYWRDVDIELSPGTVIEDLMSFNYDVIVPNVWRPLPKFLNSEQPYDLNSWIESPPALELAQTLDEDDVIVEGYAEYPTWRVHLGNLRQVHGDPKEVIDLDGVGGVSILAKAKLFRNGINFPAFTFENHAETEAFGKMARKMGFRVGGLPHYTLWHIYEPSEDDLKDMAIREREGRRD